VLQLRISPRASEDLIEIWSFIADDSLTNADSFIDELHETIQLLGRQPGLGRQREDLAVGIQSLPFRRYIIFYRVVPNSVEIVRVLHGARDVENLFDAGRSDTE